MATAVMSMYVVLKVAFFLVIKRERKRLIAPILRIL